MILVKNVKIFISCFCLEISLDYMFGDVLNRKQAFQDYTNISFYLATKLDVSWGAGPGFWSKFLIFLIFFSRGKNSSWKMFGDALDRKKAFLNYKNISFTQLPNWMFSKG